MKKAICSGCILYAGVGVAAPVFVAHRGASRDAPENTVAAFNLAWEQGADGIEGDFRLTKDGQIVCVHDDSAKRTAGSDVKIAQATLAELRGLDAGSWKADKWKDARIPTVDEVLATVPKDKRVVMEIKCGPEILPSVKKAIAASGLETNQAVIIAFNARVIAEAKRLLPQHKAFWLTDFKTDKKTGAVTPSAKEILATLDKIGADGVACKAHAVVDQEFVRLFREAHMEVHVWTVDDLPTAKRLAKLGVDSITSNRAGWLKRQIGTKSGGE